LAKGVILLITVVDSVFVRQFQVTMVAGAVDFMVELFGGLGLEFKGFVLASSGGDG
jgi:hypothetical protein